MLEAALITERLRKRLRADKSVQLARKDAARQSGRAAHRDALPLKALATLIITAVEVALKHGFEGGEDEKTLADCLYGYASTHGDSEVSAFIDAFPEWLEEHCLTTLDAAARL